MAGNFKHPCVAGIICNPKEEKHCRALKRKFDAMIKKRRMPIAYLILKTNPKSLKNIRDYMKMMDVIAVNLDTRYSPEKSYNFILNKNGRFYEYLLRDIVVESLDLLSMSLRVRPKRTKQSPKRN